MKKANWEKEKTKLTEKGLPWVFADNIKHCHFHRAGLRVQEGRNANIEWG